MDRKRTDQSIFVNYVTKFDTKFSILLKSGRQKSGEESQKAFKSLSNVGTTKLKGILVSTTKQEIFEATKLVTETTWSKPLGLEVQQTAKPNQTSLALCIRFLSPSHY